MTPDNPYGPFDVAGGDTIKCPYCAEPDFDAVGLKGHLLAGDCAVWNETDVPTRLFGSAQETFPDHICRHGHPDRTCRECFPLNRR